MRSSFSQDELKGGPGSGPRPGQGRGYRVSSQYSPYGKLEAYKVERHSPREDEPDRWISTQTSLTKEDAERIAEEGSSRYPKGIGEQAHRDYSKYIKPTSVNYKTGSPYGLIHPSFVLSIGSEKVYLPNDHSEYMALVNSIQPKTPLELRNIRLPTRKSFEPSPVPNLSSAEKSQLASAIKSRVDEEFLKGGPGSGPRPGHSKDISTQIQTKQGTLSAYLDRSSSNEANITVKDPTGNIVAESTLTKNPDSSWVNGLSIRR